jgi:hypothetical protein
LTRFLSRFFVLHSFLCHQGMFAPSRGFFDQICLELSLSG